MNHQGTENTESLTQFFVPLSLCVKSYSWLIIILLGAWLRFHALAQDTRFHPDEALFATFARSAAVQGDWLLHGHLDKPPLTIYTNALAMTFFGVTTLPDGVLTLDVHRGEFAARIPSTFASILLIAVMYRIANVRQRKLTQRHKDTKNISSNLCVLGVSVVQCPFAALLMALSPLALAFSATAFTDTLMLLCVTLGLWAGLRGGWLWAGLWLALGFWCKQQTLLYVPLIAVLAYPTPTPPRVQGAAFRQYGLRLTKMFIPIVIGIIALSLWDSWRGQSTSLWALATANNDPGRLAYTSELIPRLHKWAEYGQFLAGPAILTAILVAIGLYGVYHWRSNLIGRLLLTYVAIYLLAHWLIAINIYDRYLLLILPPTLLLIVRGVDAISLNKKSLCLCVFVLSFFALMALPAAREATEGRLPIGGDQGQHQGIDKLGKYLDNKTLGAIIYDHWLGWELGYYIGTWSDKRRVYYPTPEALVTDGLLQPDPAPRYFVAPLTEDFQPWLDALDQAHFDIRLDYQQAGFVVYELISPATNKERSG